VARTVAVCLPHDYLTWRLSGGALDRLTTDRGDASGTAYYTAATGTYRTDLLELALGAVPALPRVLGPSDDSGRTPAGALLGAGTGDNMAAALGVGAEPGDVVVSIGTSGTAFAVADKPSADATGMVAGFADATGRFLPLVCTLNAARVLDAVTRMLGVDHEQFAALALSAPPGADGLTLVPYLEGERTPNLPTATGALHGLRLSNATPAHQARAAVEGMLCGLADAIDALVAQGVRTDRVLLVGGGARSAAVRRIAPTVLGRPVLVPEPGEYVADGAARQAAWTLAGGEAPPNWRLGAMQRMSGDPTPGLRERYAEARDKILDRPV
jgi:xylulokinase